MWQLRGGTPGGLVTDGMRAVDGIAPCGMVAPVRVNGGLAGGQPHVASLAGAAQTPAGEANPCVQGLRGTPDFTRGEDITTCLPPHCGDGLPITPSNRWGRQGSDKLLFCSTGSGNANAGVLPQRHQTPSSTRNRASRRPLTLPPRSIRSRRGIRPVPRPVWVRQTVRHEHPAKAHASPLTTALPCP